MPRREFNEQCVAERDAREHNRRGAITWCGETDPRGSGHSCCRRHGHSGTVHVSTARRGQDVLAKWDDDGNSYE